MNISAEIGVRQSSLIPQEAIEGSDSSSKVKGIWTEALEILEGNKAKSPSIRSSMDEIKELRSKKQSWAEISTYLQKEKGISIEARMLNSRYNSFQRKEREKNLVAISDPLFAIEGASELTQPIDDEAYFSDASLDRVPFEHVCLKSAEVDSVEESSFPPGGALGRISLEHGTELKDAAEAFVSTDKMLDLWDQYHSSNKRKAGDAFNS